MKFQSYKWLKFFNKNGEELNFSYNEEEDKWYGNIYLNSVSVGLIEYEPIYILEEVSFVDIGNNFEEKTEYIKPSKAQIESFCPGYNGSTFIGRWKDNNEGTSIQNVEEIFMWDVEGYPGPDPSILKIDELLITDLRRLFDTNGKRSIISYNIEPYKEPLSIRVGIQSEDEGSFSRTLQLIDPDYVEETSYRQFNCNNISEHVFCEIRFYGEVEGEDVRLETMIENLGGFVSQSDFKIYDDTDINEALPDYIKLNQKRKELLLEFHNIFPYTGSYKALINILKYYGYDQVKLKEYWLNIDEYLGKNPEGISRIRYKQTPIEDLFSTNPKTTRSSRNLIPSKLYKKTSKFGLFYDITSDVPGEFDDDGLPIVEEKFLFSNEEVLIKLFALKQKLKKYFLPLNARIIDIVGEAVYYGLYDINIWSDVLRVDDIEVNINPCIEITPENGYNLISHINSTVDYPCASIGSTFTVENCSFNLSWDESVIIWDGLGSGSTAFYDWENIGYQNFYEMEWIITYDGNISWENRSGILDLATGATYSFNVPYEGTYSIEMILYDSFGGQSRTFQKGKLEVETRDIDFIGHYKYREGDYTWDTLNSKVQQSDSTESRNLLPNWTDYNSTWNIPTTPNENISLFDITWNDINVEYFYSTQNDPRYQGYCGPTASLPIISNGSEGLYDLDTYKWNMIGFESQWDDVYHLWWDGIAGVTTINDSVDWDTIRVHKYSQTFPLLTQINFTYSNSKMVGKGSPNWTLIKEGDPNWMNIYYNNPYFTYTFTERGSYTIVLKLKDNQGNTKTKTKKEFIKII